MLISKSLYVVGVREWLGRVGDDLLGPSDYDGAGVGERSDKYHLVVGVMWVRLWGGGAGAGAGQWMKW